MVELQIVILAVAGSSPVGHPPRAAREIPNPKPKFQRLWDLDLGIWDFRRQAAWHVRCLRAVMLNPAIVGPAKSNVISGDFWLRLLNDEQLSACDDLEKLVIGCEIIAALDIVDLIAA
jgi:hypothetical protein